MKMFQAIPLLAVATLLTGGCGDSSSSAPTQVAPMPQEQQDSIRKAMEANKVVPGAGKQDSMRKAIEANKGARGKTSETK